MCKKCVRACVKGWASNAFVIAFVLFVVVVFSLLSAIFFNCVVLFCFKVSHSLFILRQVSMAVNLFSGEGLVGNVLRNAVTSIASPMQPAPEVKESYLNSLSIAQYPFVVETLRINNMIFCPPPPPRKCLNFIKRENHSLGRVGSIHSLNTHYNIKIKT